MRAASGASISTERFPSLGHHVTIDQLFGQSDNDNLLGKGGADPLFGGQDNDVLTGGEADDQVFGESGSDRMVWAPGDDTDLNEGEADHSMKPWMLSSTI